MTQLAKLFLRGSLVNETMKGLNDKQRESVEDKLVELLGNSSLSKCREVFCRVLSQTIGNEYKDRDVAMEDYTIALWRGVVNALYHKPTPEVFDDPRQTEKYFKTWVYNYMRQILNENKIPTTSNINKVEGQPHVVAHLEFCAVLEQNNIPYILRPSENNYIIDGEISIITKKVAEKFGNLISKYENHGVRINIGHGKIEIVGSPNSKIIRANIKKPSRVRMMSFESDDEDNDVVRYNLEFRLLGSNNNDNHEFELNDRMKKLRNLLPNDLRDIFDIIITSEGISNKNHIASRLGISQQEVNRRMGKLGTYYLASSV